MEVGFHAPMVLFGTDVRYVIPTFQRPYVWKQESQWEPLWSDVRDTADEYLEALVLSDGDQMAAAQTTSPHFMGALVVQQQPTPPDHPQRRDVIDGQQRLTTLQLLLDAARQVLEQLALRAPAARLATYVTNNQVYAEADPDFLFKVWPSEVDREPFRHAMRNDLPVVAFDTSLIVRAHQFFQTQVEEWLRADEGQIPARAAALETVLTSLLRVVVISLDSKDDPNVIFETLNARGTPLIQSDLIKNFLLLEARKRNLDEAKLHQSTWKSLETQWWRKEIGQGRLYRPRLDVFLNYWLAMRTANDIPPDKVFELFRDYAKDGDLDGLARDIHRSAEVYQGLELASDPVEATFMYRWRVMDAGVLTPFLLLLFCSEPGLSVERRRRALRAVESYLVRRMICRMTAKDYNKLFIELIKEIQETGIATADDTTVAFLARQNAESRLWPSDSAVSQALMDLPLYRLLTRGRLRFVLEALEDSRRGEKTEQRVERNLTIEHLMPQEWRTNWPTPTGGEDIAQLEAARDRIIHTIGNLTLVKGKLNSGLSNGPWHDKRMALNKHTVLLMNNAIEKEPDWNETTIATRGSDLARRFARVWPMPAGI